MSRKEQRKLPKPSEQELKIIQECALQVSSSTWIPGYDTEDIRQEAIIIGINGLRVYNGSIPLDKFLLNHMRHRLRSLRKEKYTKPGCNCGECLKCRNNANRVKLNNAGDITTITTEQESSSLGYTITDNLDYNEFIDHIDKNLPAEYREDYLKILAGSYVVSSRKNKIRKIIKDLLND